MYSLHAGEFRRDFLLLNDKKVWIGGESSMVTDVNAKIVTGYTRSHRPKGEIAAKLYAAV